MKEVRRLIMIGLLCLSGCKDFSVTDKAPGSGGGGTPTSSIAFGGLTSIDNVTESGARLNWTHASGAATYIVYEVTSGNPSLVATVTAPTATYSLTGLGSSTSHTYRVRLLDSQGLFDANTSDRATTTSAITATFNGWTHVKATGPKAPAAQASDMATAAASVTITWPAVTFSAGSIASYNVYRATSSGGQNYSSPLSTGIAAGTRSYTDSTVTAGTTYYYTIAAVDGGGTMVRPTTVADSELKVIVPKDNMVLLHRWAANIEMCGEMGKAVDRNNNYRCAVAVGANAPPGTGNSGFVDLGASLLVDAYELGCNYTYSSTANKCGSANGCIGLLTDPNGSVTGNNGDVYYSRRWGLCYVNNSAGAGTSWVQAQNTTSSLRQLMGSSAPGLPPLSYTGQVESQQICNGLTVSGLAGTKRLLKRRELVLVGAWDSSATNATINTLENGTNLDTTHACNSNHAHPQSNNNTDISGTNPTIAFSDSVIPSAKDTLPGCRSDDCAGAGTNSIRSVRTGSSLTSSCVSRYGAQDTAGNVWEWTSDQLNCNGASCAGVTAAANTADSSNDDFNGLAIDGTQGGTLGSTFGWYGKMQLPVAIPVAGAGFAGDGTVVRDATQTRNDYYWVDVGNSLRGSLTGGSHYDGQSSGRFSMFNSYHPSAQWKNFGARCAIPAE